jgi:hypothetical protein
LKTERQLHCARLAERLEAWIEAQVSAGIWHWHPTAKGDVQTKELHGVSRPMLADVSWQAVSTLLGAAGGPPRHDSAGVYLLDRLRVADTTVAPIVWQRVEDRLGLSGPLPSIAEVEAARMAYWRVG